MKNAKIATIVLGLFLILGMEAVHGDDAKPTVLAQIKTLGLGDTDVQSLEDIVLGSYQAIVAARADVTSDRAIMTRQLLLPNITVKDLEPTVRHSIEAEMKIRLAELDRQLKIRRLVGNKRWATLMDLAATLKKQTPAPDDPVDDPQTNRILNVLRVLGS